ncbi:MAG: ABC transporter ATP-binding protein [Acidobacteriota bacterium]|nr:ABC transporter ATP-binding protein [Acidobacteriota bacterium]
MLSISSFSGEGLALLGALGGFVVLWYGGGEMIRDNFTIGGYVAFVAYLGKLYGPTQIVASLGLTIQPALSALDRVKELFDFIIHPGENVVFAGPNGSGKSTIIKLILGLYPVDWGKIFIDDHDINSLALSSLRERIGTVSQNCFLFNDTIRNNIRYGNPNAGEEEIVEAAKKAGAHDFIMKLEKGFDTEIGETGKKLSGGEKQKIAIARAYIKKSDVIIVDEMATHLDCGSEEMIYGALADGYADKTCIIIAHNADVIRMGNRVLVVDQGRIIEKHPAPNTANI